MKQAIQKPPLKFGTGGWRAIIGEDFIKDNVQKLMQGMALDILAQGCAEVPVVIGYDRRFLSDRAARWAAEVLAGNGISVYLIDKIAPTPLIMYAVKHFELQYGLAVTASHNPAYYNGIKVFTEGGRDASEMVTQRLERLTASVDEADIQRMPFEDGQAEKLIRSVDPSNAYLDGILHMIDVQTIRNRGLKILLDPMFGVSKTCLQTILLTARCDVDTINDRHDTLFGGRLPSPSALTLTRLKDMVVEQRYDLGIGTDGDADRIGIIDDRGRFIHPNEIMVLLYYYLLKYKGWKGGVVRNLATTHLLDKIAEDFGETAYEVPVGFKHISSKLEETDALLGGESSGGLTIRGHIKGKDGIFAAALLVELICVTGMDLSVLIEEIYARYGRCYMAEKDCSFKADSKEKLRERIFSERILPETAYPIERISYLDGLKIYLKNGGWVVIRFSGTEPLLRIFTEMPTEMEANRLSTEIEAFIYGLI